MIVVNLLAVTWWLNIAYPVDSATHLSEETAHAARAAPLAILVSVAYTSVMGWLLLISVSFAIPSVNGLLEDDFSTFPIRQVFHRVLGRQGLLSVWSMIIIVQVRHAFSLFKHHVYPTFASTCPLLR